MGGFLRLLSLLRLSFVFCFAVFPLQGWQPVNIFIHALSLVLFFRAIFKEAGRGGDWNTALGLGNPAASAEVKVYLKAFRSEQLQAAVTPKQATPLFLVKIVQLSRLIQGKLLVSGITASRLFVYARDAALFKTLFLSGDWANDLTLVKTQEIRRFPRNDGLLFNHVWGKSLRDGSANLFGIRRHSDLSLCPVKATVLYIAISSALSLDLLSGYLFRPLSSSGKIQNKQTLWNMLVGATLPQLPII